MMKLRHSILITLVMATINLQAAPLDEKQVLVLLESGFTTAEVAAEIEKQGYTGANDKATLQRLRTAGADAAIIILLAKAAPNSEKPPAKDTATVATDFYQTGADRVQMLMNEGRYGLKLKGEVVVAAEWDYWKKSFPGDNGAGTITFSNISSAGYLLISKTRKRASLVTAAMIDKPAAITEESDIKAWVNCYMLDYASEEDKKGKKLFDKSIQFTVPPTDDPRALFPFPEIKKKPGVASNQGLQLATGETICPPDVDHVSRLIALPVQKPVSQDKRVLGALAFGLKMAELTAMAGTAADNLKTAFIEMKMGGVPQVGGSSSEPRLKFILFDQSAAAMFLDPPEVDYLNQWSQAGADRDLLYVKFQRQMDNTYKARVFYQKNNWPPEDVADFFRRFPVE